MDSGDDETAATRATSLARPLLRFLAAVGAGFVVTTGAALGLLATGESILATVVWAPLSGGFVAGVCTSRGRGLGAVAGLTTGTLAGVALLAGFVRLVSSTAPATGGAGPAIAITFVTVFVIGVCCVLLTTLGAVLGTKLRARSGRPDAVSPDADG